MLFAPDKFSEIERHAKEASPPLAVRNAGENGDRMAAWLDGEAPDTPAGFEAGWECLQEAGDLVFVPRNWFHAVVNLEDDTVAIAGQPSPVRHPPSQASPPAQRSSVSGALALAQRSLTSLSLPCRQDVLGFGHKTKDRKRQRSTQPGQPSATEQANKLHAKPPSDNPDRMDEASFSRLIVPQIMARGRRSPLSPRQMFMRYDVDRSGYLDKKEMDKATKGLNLIKGEV